MLIFLFFRSRDLCPVMLGDITTFFYSCVYQMKIVDHIVDDPLLIEMTFRPFV